MTAGGSSIPEVQALLRVLATGRRVAEVGTAFGEGAVAIAETAASLVTVERDGERARVARERLEPYTNVEFVEGDWRDVLPQRAPFDLVFFDGGGWKRDPSYAQGGIDLLAAGGLFVADDFTPGRPVDGDAAREYVAGHPQLVATEVVVSPEMSVVIAARVR